MKSEQRWSAWGSWSAANSVFDTCDPARHLYIAVPAYSGEVVADCVHSLCEGIRYLERAGVALTIDFVCGCAYLEHARNILVTKFLKSDATDLLFIDADVGFDPKGVLQLALAKRPFIAGVYPKKTADGSMVFPVEFAADELWADVDGYIEAARVPTGFLRLNRGVFDLMPHHDYHSDDGDFLGYFEAGNRNGVFGSEDWHFCDDWRSLGGKIYMIPEVTFGHSGLKRWTGNWGLYMKSQLAGQHGI